jgi:hypothetical protein
MSNNNELVKVDKNNETQEENPFNLFNNPAIQAAKKALSPEDAAHYNTMGEEFYGKMNFDKMAEIDPVEEASAYIVDGLRSGLHPSFLEENEKEVLTEYFGEKWYETWGWTAEDLAKIN